MKLNIEFIKNEINPLPGNAFTDRIRQVLEYHSILYKSGRGDIKKVKDGLRSMMAKYKEDNFNFKMERWNIVLRKGVLTVRFGYKGAPHIVIKEEKIHG